MELHTDDKIISRQSNWVFDEHVAPEFDKHVKKSVPNYTHVQELAETFSDWFTYPSSTVIDFGASTGETLRRIKRRHTKELTLIGYDNSQAMIEQAKLNPNEKLREAMKPPTYDGIVIEDTTLQGYIATIPAGAIIPIMLLDSSVSRKDFIGEPYKAKFPKNLITPEHYLLFPEGCMVYGDIQDVKPQRFFIRHGDICLRTCTLDAPHNPGTTFAGVVIDPPAKHGFWKKEFVEKTRIKGAKRYYDKGMVVNVKLLKPIKVDLTNGYIVE